MRGELQIGFVNISERRGRSLGQQRSDPAPARIAQGGGAERMNMHGDGARDETKIRLSERTGNGARVPSIIKCAISHRIPVWKNRRRIIENDGDARLS